MLRFILSAVVILSAANLQADYRTEYGPSARDYGHAMQYAQGYSAYVPQPYYGGYYSAPYYAPYGYGGYGGYGGYAPSRYLGGPVNIYRPYPQQSESYWYVPNIYGGGGTYYGQ